VEKLKLRSDGGVVARNANETMVVPMVGSGGVCVWGSLESGGRFCVGAFVKNLASVAVKMFSHFNLLCK
jgi:hypothetical protein